MAKQKNYSNNRELALRHEKFIQALEGIGDVLVFETKRRNRNKNVIQGLKRINSIIKTFFDIQKSDPEKFEQLILTQEFFELYRKNETEAKLGLAFNPEKYLVSFSTAVNQIIRIHEAALETKNEEISKFATYHLNWLLADITTIPKNELFVEQLLKNLGEVTTTAIENQDRSMYAASIHWYIDIVFNRLGQKEGNFDLSYLDLLDKYFFSSIKYIISQNQTSLFDSLISSIVDGVHIPSYYCGKVWDYGHLILRSNLEKYNQLDKEHQLSKHIKELANSENDLDTKEKRDGWLKKFEELKKILELHLDKEQQKNALKIEEEIIEFIDGQFKYSNLLEIIFAIGAYCLFKQRMEYIKHLWEYKQPPDSDASWIGHDILPNTIDGVINFYFKKDLFERKFDFFGEGHHGSEKYYNKYFLLLLARLLQSMRANSDGRYEQIERYNLPDLHVYRLSDLEHSIDGFLELARELKTERETLGLLGFEITTLEELFDIKLVPFLNSLKLKAQERIKNLQRNQQMSKKKISEFKDEVLKGFNTSTILRDIFKYYNIYHDKTGEKYKGKSARSGINTIDAKAAFFDEWHIHYADWGANYGRNLASGENSLLLEKIASQCREIKESDFERILEQFQDLSNAIIFATNIMLYKFFENSTNFKPKWHGDILQLDVKGFEGYYSFSGKDIPIFENYHESISEQILVLNKTKLGTLIQYSPLNEGESEELNKDIFYINVQAFSENKELMDKSIQEAPEWLQKIGNGEKQREHLQERVLIHIFERYEYSMPKDFEGYLLKAVAEKSSVEQKA